ncbi:MAG: hypothetical protein ACE5RK_09090, partial [Candidatus Nitrosomaritimum aestuariumsis]
GGRLVLINSILTSMVLLMLSFFEVPRGVLERIEYFRSRFFWQHDDHKKKYRLAKWDVLCQPRDQGGMGIMNIDTQNKCLLSKWWYKLLHEQGIWQDLLRRKYMHGKAIGQVQRKQGDSQFWTGLMKVKDLFLRFGTFQLNNGANIRFWEDIWTGNSPLKQQYPHLYRIARHKHDTVASVFRSVPLNISFRRSLTGDNLQSWYDLVSKIAHERLNEREDVFRWGLNQNGIFKVRTMYNAMTTGSIWSNRLLWKLKLPLKIKIFLWYLNKCVTLIKDNLVRRNWTGSTSCAFCNREETIQHLFFECHYAKFLWRALQITFGIHSPTSINDMFTSWLLALGQKRRKQIIVGATTICWSI